MSQYIEDDMDDRAKTLSNKFEELVGEYLEKKIVDGTYAALESCPLKERLKKTICLRQQYFAYLTWQRDSKTIPQQKQDVRAPRRRRLGSSGSVVSVSKADTTTSLTTSNNPLSKKRKLGATTADTNAQPVMTEVHGGPYKKEFATDLPARPITSNKKIKDLECPYCYLVYPVREFSEKNWP